MRILGETFLDSCHKSVVRMAETVIRKKLEMFSSGQKKVIFLIRLMIGFFGISLRSTARKEETIVGNFSHCALLLNFLSH